MTYYAFPLGLTASLLLLADFPAIAKASSGVSPLPDTAAVTRLAERRDSHLEEQQTPTRPIDAATGYPIVQANTWATEENIPWSELVLIRGDHHPDYVAVLDRSYEEGAGADLRNPGIVSLWSRHQLQVFGYGLHQVCVMGFICDAQHPIFPVSRASLRVGDRVFHLQGRRNLFEIPETVAGVLKQAPPNQVWIRVAIAGGSNYTTRPLGPNTIATWPVIYQDVEPVAVAALPEASLTPVSRLPENLPAGLPEIDESVWRRQSGVTWSEPIIVRDTFDGDYLAVLDRAYSQDSWSGSTSGIITNWSADQLAIHLYEEQGGSYTCWAVDQLKLQIGDRTFILKGHNNLFSISDQLAKVLASQPQETPMVSYQQLNDEVVTREIGSGTVAAWGMIYRAVEGDGASATSLSFN